MSFVLPNRWAPLFILRVDSIFTAANYLVFSGDFRKSKGVTYFLNMLHLSEEKLIFDFSKNRNQSRP